MSAVQRLLRAVLPKTWADSMEAASRRWMVRCPCGHAQSVWDWGGVRWKAAGRPRRYLPCSACGRSGWHTIAYELPADT